MKTIAIWAILVMAAATAASAQNIASKLGIVSVKQGSICFETSNPSLKKGQQVTIVTDEKRQSTRVATIDEKLSKSCAEMGDESHSFYSLRMSRKPEALTGIGVVGPTVTLKKGIAAADLNGDGKNDFFRSCTTGETVHFTVWSGKPLTGRRLWHGMYYAGYDLVPNCKKADYK